ncbi:polysaccharide pyruvyl transferase family protein [Arthrobacter sp. NtRootA1]|uniref:polysaccharide pyruvyl transferase family protein n=1 Tax=Arthrobacter sp. NtRootA1 TaxID=2830983 RepID=UPI001CC4CC58|nr:polysaccharide pyruvyl transferase family protein [Arthrobacter sp. NtRootA1]BCW07710.1 hypothetical protein NtRootA1_38480 [Arthrobacter sp. NtRootA1]
MSTIWETSSPKVLLLHAYSPKNSGDGLLVELAKTTVLRALGKADFRVVASEAEAFDGPGYIQWRARLLGESRGMFRRLAMLATGLFGACREITELANEADLIVAVGGGYLRGGSFGPAVKSWGAHYGQLKLAAKHGHKTIYLSQSIGPFRGPYKRSIARQLNKITTVCVRDDRSVAEFANVASISRMPDLAVLELARQPLEAQQNGLIAERPVLVAREISKPRNYYEFLNEASQSKQFEWALQSTGGGNDDLPLTQRLGGSTPRPMAKILAGSEPRIVVSTRLHGALSSLIAGFPAIHLSYERKGWGAYEDIGLGDYVLNARDATMAQVTALMERIRTDPEEFWSRIRAKQAEIRTVEARLLDSIKSIVAGTTSRSSDHFN